MFTTAACWIVAHPPAGLLPPVGQVQGQPRRVRRAHHCLLPHQEGAGASVGAWSAGVMPHCGEHASHGGLQASLQTTLPRHWATFSCLPCQPALHRRPLPPRRRAPPTRRSPPSAATLAGPSAPCTPAACATGTCLASSASPGAATPPARSEQRTAAQLQHWPVGLAAMLPAAVPHVPMAKSPPCTRSG